MVKGFWLAAAVFIILLVFLSGCTTAEQPAVQPDEPDKPQATTINCGTHPATTISGLHNILVTSNPPTLIWHELDEPDVRISFLAAFNASPPLSNIKQDSFVRIYRRPDSLNIFFIIHNKQGCVVTAQEMPWWQVQMWMQGRPTIPSKMKPEKKPGNAL